MFLVIFIACLMGGLFCIDGYLLSVMDERPNAIWLIGMGAVVMVGLAGLLVYKGG